MPSSTSTLLHQLSSKLSHIRSRLNRNRGSPHNDLPITRSLFNHTQGSHLTRDETNIAYTQAQGDLKAARAPVINSTTTTSTSSGNARARRWSWANSDNFSVARMTPTTTDESDDGREAWREEWDEIKMSLKEVAKARPMITIIGEDEPEVNYDSGYCEYDYAAVLRGPQVPGQKRSQERVEGSRAAFERVVRELNEIASQVREEEEEEAEEEAEEEQQEGQQHEAVDSQKGTLRQIALAMSDDEEEREEEEMVVYSSDRGSMRTNHGRVASGDVWW